MTFVKKFGCDRLCFVCVIMNTKPVQNSDLNLNLNYIDRKAIVDIT